jgi:hypothetical protein
MAKPGEQANMSIPNPFLLIKRSPRRWWLYSGLLVVPAQFQSYAHLRVAQSYHPPSVQYKRARQKEFPISCRPASSSV